MKFKHEENLTRSYARNFTGLVKVDNFQDRPRLLPYIQEIAAVVSKQKLEAEIAPICNEWKSVFQKMGAKPKYCSSLESLYQRYFLENKLFQINEVVDFYNFYSLANGLPMAAYDVSQLVGDLTLTVADKGMIFVPLGNPKNPQPTKANEVVYRDSEKVICRYWNLQDCDQTKITLNTTSILFIFDILANDAVEAKRRFGKIDCDFSRVFEGHCVSRGLTGNEVGLEVQL